MKFENIPADIKSKSLKEAKNEIELILARLEDKNLNLNDCNQIYPNHLSCSYKIPQKTCHVHQKKNIDQLAEN